MAAVALAHRWELSAAVRDGDYLYISSNRRPDLMIGISKDGT